MAVTSYNGAGCPVQYNFWKRDSALADDASFYVDHAADPQGVRQVSAINGTTGAVIPLGASTVEVVHTSETRTTFTNRSGGALDLKAVVVVAP